MVATMMAVIIIVILGEEGVKFYITEADANLAIGAVWSNHCYGAKGVMLGSLNELKDFIVSWDENVAFLEFSFIICHMYRI